VEENDDDGEEEVANNIISYFFFTHYYLGTNKKPLAGHRVVDFMNFLQNIQGGNSDNAEIFSSN
jgi:hypothetical protein